MTNRQCVDVFACVVVCVCVDVRELLLRSVVTRRYHFYPSSTLIKSMKVPTIDDNMPWASLWHMAIVAAAANTQAIAIFGPAANARMCYGDLLMQSLRVVQGLRRAGVTEPSVAVGVCMGRGPLAVISAFAILVR